MHMENKNTYIAVAFLLVGIAFGYFLGMNSQASVGHNMSDGTVMAGTPDMHHMMDEMAAMLVGKTGDEFDKAFLEEMIVHHEGAVDMAEMALVSARHQEIKDLSNAIISAQNTEITQMKEWLRTWYGR
jgi:uncharacterized protein (DUF305 family)